MTKDMYPMLKEWELRFSKTLEGENALIMKAVTEFLVNRNMDVVQMPAASCKMSGSVFGRVGFNDGDIIMTSPIIHIQRVKRDSRAGVPHDLLCATTHSRMNYYFYSDAQSAWMSLMVGEMVHTGKLSCARYYA